MRTRIFYTVALLLVSFTAFAGGLNESDVTSETSTAAEPQQALVEITDARGQVVTVTDASRVVSLGSAVSEIIVALEQTDRLVGVDLTSTFPEEALAAIPKTGYVRDLSAEGILSLDPTLVIGTVDMGPPEVIEQIESAGVSVAVVPEDDSIAGSAERVRFIAELLSALQEADSVIADIDDQESELLQLIGDVPVDQRPSVLFIYARGAGTVMVSGAGTSADAMIQLAGGRNAVAGFGGYRPLTPEAAIGANPDYILLTSSGLGSLGGVEGLAEIPGIAQTDAFAARRILAYDDIYLLSFGPRAASAALELAEALYSE
ncbi:MAG: hemin ABC transporter substrate-binding protein [Spirochaetales bacterium]